MITSQSDSLAGLSLREGEPQRMCAIDSRGEPERGYQGPQLPLKVIVGPELK